MATFKRTTSNRTPTKPSQNFCTPSQTCSPWSPFCSTSSPRRISREQSSLGTNTGSIQTTHYTQSLHGCSLPKTSEQTLDTFTTTSQALNVQGHANFTNVASPLCAPHTLESPRSLLAQDTQKITKTVTQIGIQQKNAIIHFPPTRWGTHQRQKSTPTTSSKYCPQTPKLDKLRHKPHKNLSPPKILKKEKCVQGFSEEIKRFPTKWKDTEPVRGRHGTGRTRKKKKSRGSEEVETARAHGLVEGLHHDASGVYPLWDRNWSKMPRRSNRRTSQGATHHSICRTT